MPSNNGFVAIGTETFAVAYFDNFKVKSAKVAAEVSPPTYMIYESTSERRNIHRSSAQPDSPNVIHMQQFEETVKEKETIYL